MLAIQPTIKNAPYDNVGAYRTLQAMMARGERVSTKFFTDRDGYPCVWLESDRVSGFKYRLKMDSLQGLYNYLKHGEVADFDHAPNEVETCEAEDDDFQLSMLKQLLESGEIVQFRPMFRDAPQYVTAFIHWKKGLVFFKVERTEELLDYLTERGTILI